MKCTIAIVSTLLLAWGCSSSSGTMPQEDAAADVVEELRFADADEEVDQRGEEACTVLWNKTTFTSGATSHPALGKNDVLYVSSYQKLYAIDTLKIGTELWVWPDDDSNGPVESLDEQLYTPVIAEEGMLVMGSQANRVVAVNKNGVGRFAVETKGPVTGAPAILSNNDMIVVTDNGQRMAIKDLGQDNGYVLWEFSGDYSLENVMPGQQPLVAPDGAGGEVFWVVSEDAVHRFNASDGDSLGTTPLPEGHTTTSNAILEADGSLTLATGSVVANNYFMKHYIVTIWPDGTLADEEPTMVHEGPTRIVSVSHAQKDSLLLGTNNSGFMVYSRKSGEVQYTFYQNAFQDVAPAVQGVDGLVYFSASPHWMFILSDAGEQVWVRKLEEPDNLIGANLAPSSPVLREDGAAIFHNGNYLYAVQCTESGPAQLTWPRFGGNPANTGNLADSATQSPE